MTAAGKGGSVPAAFLYLFFGKTSCFSLSGAGRARRFRLATPESGGGLYMTIQEKQRVTVLRSAGLSYQVIADKTGISLGAIKMYFKRAKKEETPAPRCEQCQKPLRQDIVRPNRRFCSDICRVRWWTEHPKRIVDHRYTCKCCGKEFYSRIARTFCSRPCFYAYRRGGGQHE